MTSNDGFPSPLPGLRGADGVHTDVAPIPAHRLVGAGTPASAGGLLLGTPVGADGRAELAHADRRPLGNEEVSAQVPRVEVLPRETGLKDGKLVASLQTSGNDDWSTPRWLLELLFPDGKYFDPNPANSGGLRDRDGRGAWPTDVPVFLNPPYSDPAPWLRRAADHPGPVVCLVRVDPSSSWWSYSEGFKVTLIGQRLRFGRATHVAPFASAVWRKA